MNAPTQVSVNGGPNFSADIEVDLQIHSMKYELW